MIRGLRGRLAILAVAAAQLPLGPAIAQADAGQATPAPPAPASPAAVGGCPVASETAPAALCIPALTPILLRIDAPLSSRTSISGEAFPISLVDSIRLDGKDIVPAGTKGMGEVVHAKKTGMGVGGELVLAARYLEIDGRRLRLRSMKIASQGDDQQELSYAVGAAVGLPGLFIRGKHIDLPMGVKAFAKTAEAFSIDAGSGAEQPPPASPPAPPSPPTQGTYQ